MESECLIDLNDNKQDAHVQPSSDTAVFEVSLSGHGLEGLGAGSSAVTADSTLHNADPFAGIEAMVPNQASGSTPVHVVPPDPAPAAQQEPVQQPQHHEPEHEGQHSQDSSSAVSLKDAAERAARTSDVLQQHSIEQGECNAKLRLLLATVAAKQVKARKMLADLSSDFSTALTDSQSSSLQQVQDLNTQLQQAYQQVAAAQADAEQQRQAAAQQADLTHSQNKEIQQLRAELKALRKAESRLRAELRDREARLLEAQAALSQLTAELPGSRQLPGLTRSMSEDGSTAVDSSAVSNSAVDADAGDTADSGTPAGGALPLTPVGSSKKGGKKEQVGRGAGVGGSMGGALNFMTPDQAAAAQYKGLLGQTQEALMVAQDNILDLEVEIKKLKQQLQKQQLQQQQGGEQQIQQQDGGEEHRQQEQQDGHEQHTQQGQQQQGQEQQQQLQELQAAVDAAAAAAAAAGAERDQLAGTLDSLRSELMQLKLQLAAADTDRLQAMAALGALQLQQQQQGEQQQQEQPVGEAAAAASAAERAAAAEQELHKALAAAAEASAEVTTLQEKLKKLQEEQPQAQQQQQQQQEGVQRGSSADSAAAAATGAAGQGGSIELMQANCRIHVLQEELQDTQDSMRLLLQLIKKSAAASAAGVASTGALADTTLLSSAAAGALSAFEHEQLQDMLSSAECKDTALACSKDTAPAEGSDAAAGTGTKAAAAAAAEVRFELGLLHGLLTKLDSRYCPPKPLQDVMLRGKELEHMLAAALQRVHGIKAEAGGGLCACPSEQDYQQPFKVAAAAPGVSQQPAAGLHVQQPQQQQHPQQQPQDPLHGYAVIDAGAAAAAGAGPGDAYDSGNGWLPGGTSNDGYNGHIITDESSLSGGGYSGSGFASASGGWDSWAGHGFSGDGGHTVAAAGIDGGAVGGAAVRGFSTSSGPGAAAGGGGAVGGVVSGLAPLQDENMGYDGLDGAWWASSSIDKPLTADDLPDFLVKKS